MRIASIGLGLIAAGLALQGSAVSAQQKKQADRGKYQYEVSCAVCHGADGKGKGLMNDVLRRSPTDLTILAKNNQGVFPTDRLYEVIEGVGVASHGSREMPIWGMEYRVEDNERYLEARGNYDAEGLVRARILLLIDYISRIQAQAR